MNELKLYAIDSGWAGGIVVVARSAEDALKIAVEHGLESSDGSDLKLTDIFERSIEEGRCIVFIGDQ